MAHPHDVNRRARPLLGTLVEVALDAATPARTASDALEAAFSAIERVEQLMSRHNACSELSRFNQAPPGTWVALSADTTEVFAFAMALSVQTQGVFNVLTCAEHPTHASPAWQCLELDPTSRRLRKHQPAHADLGGIAKGYAVDLATQALREHGVAWGWVNAGGDARVFGDITLALHVRHPGHLSGAVDCGAIHRCAIATSAHSHQHAAQAAPRIWHGVSGQAAAPGTSWSVRAATCMAADALTKVVAATGHAHHPVLTSHSANAWIIH